MQEKYDVFLLTKPPFSPRSELCLKLAACSGNARIYLAGDGVYHMLSGIQEIPGITVFACQEDLEARGISGRENIVIPENFYVLFIKDIMENCRRSYTF